MSLQTSFITIYLNCRSHVWYNSLLKSQWQPVKHASSVNVCLINQDVLAVMQYGHLCEYVVNTLHRKWEIWKYKPVEQCKQWYIQRGSQKKWEYQESFYSKMFTSVHFLSPAKYFNAMVQTSFPVFKAVLGLFQSDTFATPTLFFLLSFPPLESFLLTISLGRGGVNREGK